MYTNTICRKAIKNVLNQNFIILRSRRNQESVFLIDSKTLRKRTSSYNPRNFDDDVECIFIYCYLKLFLLCRHIPVKD